TEALFDTHYRTVRKKVGAHVVKSLLSKFLEIPDEDINERVFSPERSKNSSTYDLFNEVTWRAKGVKNEDKAQHAAGDVMSGYLKAA
ncbi:MAG: hypothetical protein GY861_06750, partial [bacterium]|nr:hypothetical protein [bacterium]